MRKFNGGAEMRLTHADLQEIVNEWLNDRIFNVGMDKHDVEYLTLHPNNKYVVRLKVTPREG